MEYVDVPLGFHRVNKGPLDSGENVLNGDLELYQYITTQAAYPEQRLNVKYDNGKVYRVRLVQDPSVPYVKLIPIVEILGFELVTKSIGSNTYGLVYYNNSGRAYTSKTDYGRLNDPLAWDVLPLIGIISGQLNSGDIDYRLTIEGEDEDSLITMSNFLNLESEDDDEFFYMLNDNFSVGIMPKYKIDIETELWVKCNDYARVSGGI